jgi:hypothetical protein
MASLFAPSIAVVSLVGVFLIVIFANARSLLVDRSLEATTSPALLVILVLRWQERGTCLHLSRQRL